MCIKSAFRSTILPFRMAAIGIFLVLLAGVFPAKAQSTQTATTKDGRSVILKSDGTWEYAARNQVSAEHWKVFEPGQSAISITFDWQGGMFIIGTNNEMYGLDIKTKKWTALYPGIKVTSMTIKPDGTVVAVDKTNKFFYTRVGGKWSQVNGFADQVVAAKDGRLYILIDGVITESGAYIKGSSPSASAVKFKFMSAATKTNALYLVDTNNKLRGYDIGTGVAGEIVGGGNAKAICGTGYGVRAGQFINGAGTDNNTYFFEVSPKNKWVPIESQIFMKFIALNPITDGLYGVGVDNKIYYYAGTF
ncbi:hypothetical protein BH10ACI2_BH10ACI2_18820 [soil metagenome]